MNLRRCIFQLCSVVSDDHCFSDNLCRLVDSNNKLLATKKSILSSADAAKFELNQRDSCIRQLRADVSKLCKACLCDIFCSIMYHVLADSDVKWLLAILSFLL